MGSFSCLDTSGQPTYSQTDQPSCELAGGVWTSGYKCDDTACNEALKTLEDAAIAAHRGDCATLKGTTALIHVECLKHRQTGKTCGGWKKLLGENATLWQAQSASWRRSRRRAPRPTAGTTASRKRATA